MDLSSTEETIVGLLRGGVEVDFTMNVARIGGTWSVTLADHGGAAAGAGSTFCDAFLAAFGLTADPGDGEVVPIKPSLAIVGGTDKRPDSEIARAHEPRAECSRRSQNTGSGRSVSIGAAPAPKPRRCQPATGHLLRGEG